MLKTTIFKLSEDFGYELLGEIIWDGKEIRVNPDDDPQLSRIAAQPYWLSTPDKVEEFDPNRYAEAWILNLHQHYPSPKVRAGQTRSSH